MNVSRLVAILELYNFVAASSLFVNNLFVPDEKLDKNSLYPWKTLALYNREKKTMQSLTSYVEVVRVKVYPDL